MIPDDVYNELKKIASIETDAWRRLEEALRDEAQALKTQDLPEITRTVTQKDIAINSVKIGAENRRKFLLQATEKLQLKPTVSMDSLFQIADPGQRQEMSGWQAKFADYAESVHRMNQKNMDAIRTSLAVVKDSIHFLHSISEPLPRYTSEGYISAHHLQGRIVSKRG